MNWGTFHDRVWLFSPQGETSLLTGDVGSGKSTLVDALATLLVPPRKVAYNKAADSSAKERSVTSYVRGSFGQKRTSEGTGQPDSLRDTSRYSVLLATFENQGLSQFVTLAQFRCGLYLRQLAISGVDTKFIEQRKGTLAIILPEGFINQNAQSFEQRYGLRVKPVQVRLRLLDREQYIQGISALTCVKKSGLPRRIREKSLTQVEFASVSKLIHYLLLEGPVDGISGLRIPKSF